MTQAEFATSERLELHRGGLADSFEKLDAPQGLRSPDDKRGHCPPRTPAADPVPSDSHNVNVGHFAASRAADFTHSPMECASNNYGSHQSVLVGERGGGGAGADVELGEDVGQVPGHGLLR